MGSAAAVWTIAIVYFWSCSFVMSKRAAIALKLNLLQTQKVMWQISLPSSLFHLKYILLTNKTCAYLKRVTAE